MWGGPKREGSQGFVRGGHSQEGGVLEVSSPTVAETEKLVEGVYRDVNIALANEVARLCRSLGIDFDEVRDAANSQPYSHLHKPGPGGVGGSCIPVYPQFLLYAAKRIGGAQLDLTALGRQINVMSAKYVFDLIREAAGLVGGRRIRAYQCWAWPSGGATWTTRG